MNEPQVQLLLGFRTWIFGIRRHSFRFIQLEASRDRRSGRRRRVLPLRQESQLSLRSSHPRCAMDTLSGKKSKPLSLEVNWKWHLLLTVYMVAVLVPDKKEIIF